MKLRMFVILMIFGSISLTSCRDEETVVREVEVVKEVETPAVEEEDEGLLERTAKEVDEEVNQEINEEIDKIGDDN